MARPSNADPAATRAKLMTVASELFGARGEGNVSVRDIAKGAKVSVATVHHYFGSKQGLYEACLHEAYAQLDKLQAIHDLQSASTDFQLSQVRQFVQLGYNVARTRSQATRLMLRQILDDGEIKVEYFQRYSNPLLASAAKNLEESLQLNNQEGRLLAQSVVHLIVRYALSNHAELARVVGNHELSSEQVDDAIVDHLTDLIIRLIKSYLTSPTPKQISTKDS